MSTVVPLPTHENNIPDKVLFGIRKEYVYRFKEKKYLRARKRNPSFLAADVAIEVMCPCQLRSCSKATPTR